MTPPRIDVWDDYRNLWYVEIEFKGCWITPTVSGNCRPYTTKRDAIRGARRALRRIGYKGPVQQELAL